VETWPNFFIVGASKSGTTSLDAYLNEIPEVYMSPKKEPRHFHNFLHEPYLKRIKETSKYLSLFKKVQNEKAIGEASPTYLFDPDSPKLIKKSVPHARIIIILRDPVERSFSHYLMLKVTGRETESFHQVIQRGIKREKNSKEYNACLDRGLYFNQVRRYFEIFGQDKIKVLIFEEFFKDPEKTIKEILDFLDVKSESLSKIEKSYNVYREPTGKAAELILKNSILDKIAVNVIPQNIRRRLKESLTEKPKEKPKMSEMDRHSLESYYYQEVKNLQQLLRRTLPWNWITKSI